MYKNGENCNNFQNSSMIVTPAALLHESHIIFLSNKGAPLTRPLKAAWTLPFNIFTND